MKTLIALVTIITIVAVLKLGGLVSAKFISGRHSQGNIPWQFITKNRSHRSRHSSY